MLSLQPKSRYHLTILFFCWLLLQVLLLKQYGIVTTFEATKYLAQANYLLQHGRLESGNFIFYSTEILLIAACNKIGISYWPVVAIQFFFNAFSVFCLYKLIHQFTDKTKLAFFFTLLFLGMYYYQLYNVYLFTESLYFSFSILFFYGLMQTKRLSLLSVLFILSGLAVLYFTRPVGIFFLPATFVFLTLKFFPKRAFLIFSTAGVAALLIFIFLLNSSLNSGGEFDFLLPYQQEMIICGIPTTTTSTQIVVPVEQNSVQGLTYLATHHTKLFIELAGKRLAAFFGVLRSYYSVGHNIFIAFYFYGLYLCILAGLLKWKKKNRPEIAFILCLVLLTAATTALSCDEWHNRFIFTLFPFLLLLASLTFASAKKEKAV